MKILTAHIDGACKGNPGPGGYGVLFEDADGTLLLSSYGYIGNSTTNNLAEYRALFECLTLASRFSADSLLIFSDSQLLVRQINGEYSIRDTNLHLWATQIRALRELLPMETTVLHVPRALNSAADKLANLAINSKSIVPTIIHHEASYALANKTL